MGKAIREYVDNYVKYYPERWSWSLKNTPEQNEIFMRTRARRMEHSGENKDLLPDFYSIERDAAQFELCHVEWTDFFGLTWEGKKGRHALAGAPDYRGSLYYYTYEDSSDEGYYRVSEYYDAYKKQPPSDVYTRTEWNGISHWIDTANACDITILVSIYGNGLTERSWSTEKALGSGAQYFKQ